MVEQSSKNAELDMKKVIMHSMYFMVRDYSDSIVSRHFCKMSNSMKFHAYEMGEV